MVRLTDRCGDRASAAAAVSPRHQLQDARANWPDLLRAPLDSERREKKNSA